jgi:hypothetical protein
MIKVSSREGLSFKSLGRSKRKGGKEGRRNGRR